MCESMHDSDGFPLRLYIYYIIDLSIINHKLSDITFNNVLY